MIGTRFIRRFSEKSFILANEPILCPKIAHPQNSGSIVRFLKILHNEIGQ